MAKRSVTYSMKGGYDHNTGQVIEIKNQGKDNEEINIVDLRAILESLDGLTISLSLKEETEIGNEDE